MEVIASRKNPLVAQMRRVAAGDDPDRMLLDGVRLLEEARAAQAAVQTIAVSRALAAAGLAGSSPRSPASACGSCSAPMRSSRR